jgi:beta-1,4-mannosyl-glycoprotein beta-1,4-N-acetylglucosaminyltransferase
MRIFDCFPFFNELDLLEIRLHELADVVDHFVIVEARQTYAGTPKPLYFAENSARFAAFADRIVHVVASDPPKGAESGWRFQDHQRDELLRGLTEAAPDDLVLLSDADEIVRADALREFALRDAEAAEIACFELRHFNFYLNWETGERWLRSGPRAVRRKFLTLPHRLRAVRGHSHGLNDASRGLKAAWLTRRPVRRHLMLNAGWHFTYLGGAPAVQEKLQRFAGSEKPVMPDAQDAIAARIAQGVPVNPAAAYDLTLREINESFPRYLRDNRERFTALIAEQAPSRR